MSCQSAIKRTLLHEGGYANVPGDTGGETYAGVSRRYHPDWKGWALVDRWKPLRHNQIIKDTKLEGYVIDFYKIHYWDKLRADDIQDEKVAGFLFDWYVNSGSHATKAVQRLVDVAQDGKIGPMSIAAINAKGSCLFDLLKEARLAFVRGIVANNPSQKKFLTGWEKRIASFT